jgi:AcrR family transcriptional regulator
VARRAGVSTRTLYRLVPNKAALYEGMVSDRLDRFLSDFGLHVAEGADIETGLNAALMACAELTLDPEVIALQRIIMQEAGQFPDLAATFYRNGIARTATALSKWLRVQVKRGLIDIDDTEEAAGILIGMLAGAPQRAAIFGGVPLPSHAQVKARVRKCVTLFLRGCEPKRRAR